MNYTQSFLKIEIKASKTWQRCCLACGQNLACYPCVAWNGHDTMDSNIPKADLDPWKWLKDVQIKYYNSIRHWEPATIAPVFTKTHLISLCFRRVMPALKLWFRVHRVRFIENFDVSRLYLLRRRAEQRKTIPLSAAPNSNTQVSEFDHSAVGIESLCSPLGWAEIWLTVSSWSRNLHTKSLTLLQ
jgi:hypothetical protein